eukprot:1157635-Pelagomonas_calceolata.AAC.3
MEHHRSSHHAARLVMVLTGFGLHRALLQGAAFIGRARKELCHRPCRSPHRLLAALDYTELYYKVLRSWVAHAGDTGSGHLDAPAITLPCECFWLCFMGLFTEARALYAMDYSTSTDDICKGRDIPNRSELLFASNSSWPRGN